MWKRARPIPIFWKRFPLTVLFSSARGRSWLSSCNAPWTSFVRSNWQSFSNPGFWAENQVLFSYRILGYPKLSFMVQTPSTSLSVFTRSWAFWCKTSWVHYDSSNRIVSSFVFAPRTGKFWHPELKIPKTKTILLVAFWTWCKIFPGVFLMLYHSEPRYLVMLRLNVSFSFALRLRTWWRWLNFRWPASDVLVLFVPKVLKINLQGSNDALLTILR